MNIIKRIIVKIKLHNICKKYKKGSYKINYNKKQKAYRVVLYNNTNHGIYAILFSTNYPYNTMSFDRLKDNIDYFNK